MAGDGVRDRVGSYFDPALARSWLLFSGGDYSQFAVAVRSPADIVVLDIDDMVSPPDKDAARDNAARWIDERSADHLAGAKIWVRVNGCGSPWWAADLDALSRTQVSGVVLSTVESVDHVTATAERLLGVAILALVETTRGLENISEIASARSTFRLAFGVGDFCLDTGFENDPAALAHARSRFTVASSAARLPSAIDGPTVGPVSALELVRAVRTSSRFRMTAKFYLSPDQCSTINQVLSPSIDEIEWARGGGVARQDNPMARTDSEPPQVTQATTILDRAQSYRLTDAK